MGRLEGKVAVITGAGSGIGRASAVKFASEGSAVMCVDISGDDAKKTADFVSDLGGKASSLQADVSQRDEVRAALESTIWDLGSFDILYNNAGIGGGDWDRVFDVNVKGVYNGLYFGCQLLAARGGGAIVSTASLGGVVTFSFAPMTADPPVPAWGHSAYEASKAAVIQMTRQFAVNYGRSGVRVNAVAPGWIATPMTSSLSQDSERRSFLTELYPLGRNGEPEEVAAAAAFLCSNEASFITGATLMVDGGYSAR